jgi:hypothetical protein
MARIIKSRRSAPNWRKRCLFYTPSSDPNSAGELEQEFVLHYKGLFSKEDANAPREVNDSGRIQGEQMTLIRGPWTRLASTITEGMICVIPELQTVYAVKGKATDPFGDRKKIQIQILDNVSQTTTIRQLLGLY